VTSTHWLIVDPVQAAVLMKYLLVARESPEKFFNWAPSAVVN
jgi:hypothetical protein